MAYHSQQRRRSRNLGAIQSSQKQRSVLYAMFRETEMLPQCSPSPTLLQVSLELAPDLAGSLYLKSQSFLKATFFSHKEHNKF
jgi:hypothetical protein